MTSKIIETKILPAQTRGEWKEGEERKEKERNQSFINKRKRKYISNNFKNSTMLIAVINYIPSNEASNYMKQN